MNAEVYQFDITRTDKASDLHHIQAEINADENLTPEERDQLSANIREKFGSMNRAALGNHKPSFRSL